MVSKCQAPNCPFPNSSFFPGGPICRFFFVAFSPGELEPRKYVWPNFLGLTTRGPIYLEPNIVCVNETSDEPTEKGQQSKVELESQTFSSVPT